MPILNYRCPHCGKMFDELVKESGEEVRCPACKEIAERVWSGQVYSSTGKRKEGCSGNCSSCGGCG